MDFFQLVASLTACVCLLIGVALVLAYLYVVLTMPGRHKRRQQILKEYKTFAATNLVVEIGDRQIEQFYVKTANADAALLSSAACIMRTDLHRNAKKLVDLRHSRDNPSHDGETDGCPQTDREILQWFDKAFKEIDIFLTQEEQQFPSYKNALRELLLVLRRVNPVCKKSSLSCLGHIVCPWKGLTIERSAFVCSRSIQ